MSSKNHDFPRNLGPWQLGPEIGRGAYGVVCLAVGPRGKRAAVKVCERAAVDAERYARELRGAKLYRKLPPSEGLVRLLDIGECDWGFYTVMEIADWEFDFCSDGTAEYMPKTLSRVVAGEKALPVDETLQIGLALAKGLVTLQRHHLLHRDIKPGNVIYVRGCPVLSDPGLLVDEAEAASLVGTPGYVPPERFVGAGGDVYSLGLTLKAVCFGRPVEELAKGPTLEADTSNPLFAALWRILNKATDPDASRRYRSAKALLKDLQSLRRTMFFMTRFLGVSYWAWIVIVASLFSLVRVTMLATESSRRWREQDEFAAREVEKAKVNVNEAFTSMMKDLNAAIEDMDKESRKTKEGDGTK